MGLTDNCGACLNLRDCKKNKAKSSSVASYWLINAGAFWGALLKNLAAGDLKIRR